MKTDNQHIPPYFFVFDVESIGLHGEAFAVAGGVYSPSGEMKHEFAFSCPPSEADGADADRAWVASNIPPLPITHADPSEVRDAFWREWLMARAKFLSVGMAVECGWPVEANFLSACIRDGIEDRNWEGPYPLHEISSYMVAAGMDPMAKYERLPCELPAHNPLNDARQSARLLATALTPTP